MFEELEYKYRADSIKFGDFKALMQSRALKKYLSPSSWDVYYSQAGNEDSFQRFRKDPVRPELTKKVKIKETNNWVRLESDLPLDPVRATEENVAFHVGLDGYNENVRIFKHCEIFFDENLNFVYYVVFDEHLKELGRFIEVEVNKDAVARLNADFGSNAMDQLRRGEQFLEPLGITAQNRLKKSLFELYRKEVP